MISKRYFFIAVLCMTFSLAFSQQAILKYLPEDPNLLVRISFAKIFGKIGGADFKESAIYKDMMKDSSDNPLREILNNPAQSGLDLTSDFFMVFKTDSIPASEKNKFHLYGHLLNQNLFQTLMQKVFKKDSIHTYGTNKIVFKEDLTFCWNNDVFVISPFAKKPSEADSLKQISEKERIKAMDRLMKEKRNAAFALLTPNATGSYFIDPVFTKLMATPSDVLFWSTSTSNPAAKWMKPLEKMIKMPSLSKRKAAFLDFDAGQITIRTFNFMEDSIAQIYSRYTPATQDLELVKKLDQDGLILMMNIAFNGELAKELMNRGGFAEQIKKMKAELPLDPQQFAGTFKNNVLLAVYKKEKDSTMDSSSQKFGGYEALLALPIKDAGKFEELKKNATQILDSLKNKTVAEKLKNFKLAVKYNSAYCVISISPQTAESYLNQSPRDSGWAWAQAYQQSPFLLHLKLGALAAALKKNRPERAEEVSKKPLLGIFDQLIISGGNFEQGAVSTRIEVKSINSTDNSLKQLFQLLSASKK